MPSFKANDDGSGYGLLGTSATNPGVIGESHSGPGVFGHADIGDGVEGRSGQGRGVFGRSKEGDAVVGIGKLGRGVVGQSDQAVGVEGESHSDNGVLGQTDASPRAGVFGLNRGHDGGTGVVGLAEGLGGIGVFGSAERRGVGVVGTGATGMVAEGDAGPGLEAHSKQQHGVAGAAERNGFAGVMGRHFGAGPGVRGESPSGSGVEGRGRPGVLGEGDGDGQSGVVGHGGKKPAGGWPSTIPAGVIGQGSGFFAAGVRGWADGVGAVGVSGEADGGFSAGVQGQGPVGVRGLSTQAGLLTPGVMGSGKANGTGVVGSATSDGTGVMGAVDGDGIGVWGSTSANGTGVFGFSPFPHNVGSLCWAGRFQGAVNVTGPVHKSGGGFLIDHPQDPANRYLHHAFVESDAMRNLYDGVADLDGDGAATVTLPRWFEALNGNQLRYQLTALGAPAPELHVRSELKDGRFEIAGGRAGGRVSWQVTGVRRDPWAKTYALPTEFDKPERERGLYRHPELYGLSSDHGVDGRLIKSMRESMAGLRSQAEERTRPQHKHRPPNEDASSGHGDPG